MCNSYNISSKGYLNGGKILFLKVEHQYYLPLNVSRVRKNRLGWKMQVSPFGVLFHGVGNKNKNFKVVRAIFDY